MKERPILFHAHEVRATLDGRQTQFRRVIKPQPPEGCDYEINGAKTHALCRDIARTVFVPPTPKSSDHRLLCPYGKPGDRLWVRETFAEIPAMKPSGYFTDPKWIDRKAWYRADNDRPTWGGSKWRPSIFMPRDFSRITLEVTDVRVERVQNISHEDAKSEGVEEWATDRELPLREQRLTLHQLAFSHLWDDLNAARGFGWDSNPWVWAVSFSVVTP